jgi:hypothetical protein
MSDVVLVAIISSAAALVGALVPQLFQWLSGQREFRYFQNQRLFELETQSLRELQLAIGTARQSLSGLVSYVMSGKLSNDLLMEQFQVTDAILTSFDRQLQITSVYFPERDHDMLANFRDAMFEQLGFLRSLGDSNPDLGDRKRLWEEATSLHSKLGTSYKGTQRIIASALVPQS